MKEEPLEWIRGWWFQTPGLMFLYPSHCRQLPGLWWILMENVGSSAGRGAALGKIVLRDWSDEQAVMNVASTIE